MKNNVFKKGFTLIELMIVIVILGVLMGTILPRLTGAQARARDTGRIADLNTISQALETYFDDNGQYPGDAVGTPICLNTEDAEEILENLGGYLKGGVVPQPSRGQVNMYGAADGESCQGAYVYIPLNNRGIAFNGYALLTDVETHQRANVLASDLTWDVDTDVTDVSEVVQDLAQAEGTPIADRDKDNAADTIYVLYN